MSIILTVLLLAFAVTPKSEQAPKPKKARVVKQPLQLPACGQPYPYFKVGGGEIFLNGKPVQLMSAGVWQRGGMRYMRYEVSTSDTSFALSPVSMPGLILGLAFKSDQAPDTLTVTYSATGANAGLIEPHGYLRYAGEGSVLRFVLAKNEARKIVVRFRLDATENKRYGFPQCVIEGTFDDFPLVVSQK